MQFHEPNFWHQSHAWLTPDDGSPGSGLISLGWNAGTIHLQYVGLPQLSKPAVDAISATMRDFNAQCQLLAFMHAGVLGSQRAIQEQLGSKANRAGSFTLSGYYGEGKAQAIWARLPVGEVIDAFAENGEFERLYAKAFVVFSYHLWEDFARPRIAQELGVDHNDVKSELMGEWRYLRHWLVHPHGDTERDYFKNANMLAVVLPSLQPGHPEMKADWVFPLVGCLNSLDLTVNPGGLDPAFEITEAPRQMIEQIALEQQGSGTVVAPLWRRFTPQATP